MMQVMGVDVEGLAESITLTVTEQLHRHLDLDALTEHMAGMRRELTEMRKVLTKIEKNTRG